MSTEPAPDVIRYTGRRRSRSRPFAAHCTRCVWHCSGGYYRVLGAAHEHASTHGGGAETDPQPAADAETAEQ